MLLILNSDAGHSPLIHCHSFSNVNSQKNILVINRFYGFCGKNTNHIVCEID